MANITCPRCATAWPQAYQFCGRCGGPLHPEAVAPAMAPQSIPPPPSGPAPQDPLQLRRTQLVVLRGAVTEGTAFALRPGVSSLGRQGDLAFPEDPLLSSPHVIFDRSPETLDITSVPAPAGLFRRLREPTIIRSGDVVFAGEQYLLVRLGDQVPSEPAPPGPAPAEIFGTPLPAPRLHVTQLLLGGLPGRVVSTDREMITVGRENADLSFPQDRFMSSKHLRFEVAKSGHIQVIDVGSLNGTFVRVTRMPTRLHRGDEILVGGMLFRVDIDEP